MADKLGPLYDLRALEVSVQRSGTTEFVIEMRNFADTFGFRAIIKPGGPDPDDVFFELLRHDADIIVAARPNGTESALKYTIGLMPKRSQPPPPTETLALLTDGLKRHLGRVPGLVILEER